MEKKIEFSSPIKMIKVLEPRRNIVLADAQMGIVPNKGINNSPSKSQSAHSNTTATVQDINKENEVKEGWIPLISASEWDANAPVFLKLQIQYELLNIAIQRLNSFIATSVINNIHQKHSNRKTGPMF